MYIVYPGNLKSSLQLFWTIQVVANHSSLLCCSTLEVLPLSTYTLRPINVLSASPLHTLLRLSNCCYYLCFLGSTFLLPCVRGDVCWSFCSWVISITSSIRFPFFYKWIIPTVYMYHISFTDSPIIRHLSWFTIVSSTAVIIHLQRPLHQAGFGSWAM